MNATPYHDKTPYHTRPYPYHVPLSYDKGIMILRGLNPMIRGDKGGANHGYVIRGVIRMHIFTYILLSEPLFKNEK